MPDLLILWGSWRSPERSSGYWWENGEIFGRSHLGFLVDGGREDLGPFSGFAIVFLDRKYEGKGRWWRQSIQFQAEEAVWTESVSFRSSVHLLLLFSWISSWKKTNLFAWIFITFLLLFFFSWTFWVESIRWEHLETTTTTLPNWTGTSVLNHLFVSLAVFLYSSLCNTRFPLSSWIPVVLFVTYVNLPYFYSSGNAQLEANSCFSSCFYKFAFSFFVSFFCFCHIANLFILVSNVVSCIVMKVWPTPNVDYFCSSCGSWVTSSIYYVSLLLV